MKTRIAALGLITVTTMLIGCAQDSAQESAAAHAQTAPKMKMSTPVPPGVATADSVETRLGTLRFTDGFPDDVTVEKVLDNLDFQRAVHSVLVSIPAASLHAMREGVRTGRHYEVVSIPTPRWTTLRRGAARQREPSRGASCAPKTSLHLSIAGQTRAVENLVFTVGWGASG